MHKELELTQAYALDTHTHADHITGAGDLRDATGCITLVGEKAASRCASGALKDGDEINIGSLTLKALFTPGHTDDSYSFLLRSEERRVGNECRSACSAASEP